MCIKYYLETLSALPNFETAAMQWPLSSLVKELFKQKNYVMSH